MLRPGQKFDRYRIVEKLGEGGMASVWKAENPFGLPAVLKVLNADLAMQEELLERFRREGRIQFTLRHPHIVRVTDIVESEGTLALVMDFLEGEDLETALARKRPMTLEQKLELAVKVLDALQLAHDNGYIHRDLKPSNIFLEATEGGFEPRLMDFGIAKVSEAAALTRAQEFCGTPAYASPEQIESTRDVDARSDQYSFGVVLWELLSGVEPWMGITDPLQILMKVVREPLPPLPTTVPLWLRNVVKRATSKKAEGRYESVRAFQEALLRGASQDAALVSTAADLERQVLGSAAGERTGGGSTVTQDSARLAVATTAVPVAPGPATRVAANAPADRGTARPPEPAERPASPARGARPLMSEPPPSEPVAGEAPHRGEEPARGTPAPRRAAGTGGRAAPFDRASASHRLWLVGAAGVAALVVGGVAFLQCGDSVRGDGDAFVRVEPGTFVMGTPTSEALRDPDEAEHTVVITRPFAMMRHEVTVGEYASLTYQSPPAFAECGEDCPAVSVSFVDACEYANLLSHRRGLRPCYLIEGSGSSRRVSWPNGLSCEGFRLPTEAEWEYAARAGESRSSWGGNVLTSGRASVDEALAEHAVYGANSEAAWSGAVDCSSWGGGLRTCGPRAVGTKRPNPLGLYDMLGNAAEWVWDPYGPYDRSRPEDPVAQHSTASRVVRGGSWMDGAEHVRLGARQPQPQIGRMGIGFRLVRTLR